MILEPFKNIYIIRDDLFPFPGGGNKARKALEYEKLLCEKGYNAIVTTGGIQSNHCRAMAVLAAKNKWKCHLVYHGDKKLFYREKGNALLVRKLPATVEFVGVDEISNAMDRAMRNYKHSGDKPFYVTGGGHDLPGGIAYVRAIKDLYEECEKVNWKPDVIFHASGTGSTQAGLIAGLAQVGWGDVDVVGVSVARKKERGVEVIEEFLSVLTRHLNLPDQSNKIIFNTDYLYGGYEQFIPTMKDWLNMIMKETGVFFDTTYSGKALWGMHNILMKEYHNKKILFWHTGGLMNLMK